MTSSSSSPPDPPEMKMVALPKKHTAARLNDVETDVAEMKTQTDRGRRQRKLIWIGVAGLCAGLLLAYGLIVYLLMGRADSRRYYNDQLQKLVCAVPPGDETRDLLRERANCGPYVAPSRSAGAPRTTSSSAPSRSPRPTPTGEAALIPTTAPTSAAPSPRTSTTTRPAAPQTVTLQPRPAVTRTAVRTATPTPSGTSGLLPGLLCTLLGCD